MIHRLLNPLKTNSLFIFGARGTGKSTLATSMFASRSHYIDLLDEDIYDQYLLHPKRLEALCETKKFEWIIIDEIQRVPKLLNSVHRMIEKTKQKFVLTGSSSRKLKRGGANLLAGRAFFYVLHPINYLEIKENFHLETHLRWGSLPKIFDLASDKEKKTFLRSYVLSYLREEIQSEQIIRKLEPFREFLPVAAQCSGKVLNYSKIAREVGVETHTIQNYFSILEETYIGFYLPHFHRSIRKSQIQAPKFYLFDNGIKRYLEGSLESAPVPGTSYFGEIFESFIVQEIFRLNQYFEKDYRLSYFKTKHRNEVDLILSKGKKIYLIEVKSSSKIDESEVSKLQQSSEAFGSVNGTFYLSQDDIELDLRGVKCRSWKYFLENFETIL